MLQQGEGSSDANVAGTSGGRPLLPEQGLGDPTRLELKPLYMPSQFWRDGSGLLLPQEFRVAHVSQNLGSALRSEPGLGEVCTAEGRCMLRRGGPCPGNIRHLARLRAEAAIPSHLYPSTCWMVQRLTSRRLANSRWLTPLDRSSLM